MSGFRMRAGFARACGAALLLTLVLVVSPLSPRALHAEDASEDPFLVEVIDDGDGRLLDVRICPLPPPETRMPAVASSLEELRDVATVLSEVPAYDWCSGCSATSAAMLFGYYDRNGYSDMYTGPAEGGLCPLNNVTAWASGESPLSATHQGYDELSERGHVDDYWSSMGSSLDPYYGNWTEHGYADCTADFMGTNQYVNWSNIDGSTTFYFDTDNAPLYDYSGSEGSTPPRRDGCHGMRLFAESRGYPVVQNYNQYIYGFGGTAAGFMFDQYTQEIDAGRPVLIQVAGHTMLGVGYDDPDTVYIHDTWDNSVHSMTWGGSYSGLVHYGVSVIELEPTGPVPEVVTVAADAVEETTATLRGTLSSDGGEACEYRFRYGTLPGTYTVETAWTGSIISGQDFSEGVTGLAKGIAYFYVAQAGNGAGTATGGEEQFVTKPDPPALPSAAAAGTDTVNLDWVKGEGAGNTQVQRNTGSYPTGRTDGVTAYYGDAVSVSDAGLASGTTYYYRAWSEASAGGQWSDGYVEAQATTEGAGPSVSTQAATSVMAESATLNGTVEDDVGETCEYRFEYDADSGEPYEWNTTWSGSVSTGEAFSETASILSPGTTHYFRAQLRNGAGTSSGAELSFTTQPAAPVDLSATASGPDAVDLSWTVGAGADKTLVVRKTGSYPVDRIDGVQVYFDSGTLCTDMGLSPATVYCYSAWSYHAGSDQWSEGYADATATTEAAGTPDISVSPSSFEVIFPPGVTRDYTLTIANSGDGTLHYTVGESVPPPAPPPPGAGDSVEATIATDIFARPAQDVKIVTDELIVKFRSGDGRTAAAQVHEKLGGVPFSWSQAGGFEVVRVPEGSSAAEMIEAYMGSGLVEYVEPNYRRQATWAPDDSLYPLQWHFEQVNAEDAWDYRRGASSDVIVAVLDTGVAYEDYGPYAQAPDLAGTTFMPGYDFVNGDSHPNDDNGHGTHVCGTIAQTTDNATGVAGLAFGATIVPVKVLDGSGTGTVAQEADGVYYAVNNGAHIVNLSLSGEGTSQTEADALAYAYSHGVTVVCAAGNDYLTGNDPQYPAAYDDYCIAVGATRYDESRAPYSSTGGYVDIVAPGGDLSEDQNSDGHPDGVLQQTLDGSFTAFDYFWWQGTSMACPHVSAAAALILSENRNWGPDDIRGTLESTAKDLGAAGPDVQYGNGLLDVAAAMEDVGGAAWLDESPKEGAVAPAGSMDVTVTVDTTGLADGDYYATIQIGSDDPARETVSVPVNLYVRSVAGPVVMTDSPTGVEEEAATLHGTLVDDGWEACEFRFEYATQSGGPYAATDWSGSLGSGEQFSESLSDLDEGTVYYFRACARNSAATGYGDEIAFTTKPLEPSAFTAAPDPSFPYARINLTWTVGAGAEKTMVLGKLGSYPENIYDGYLVYDGAGGSCSDSGLEPSSTYYYRAWSWVEDHQGAELWSDVSSEASASTDAAPATEELQIVLRSGWNMISVPLIMPDMSVSTLLPNVDAVYLWNPASKSYVQPQELEPTVGYWVASSAGETLTLEGIPVESWLEQPMVAGWNMMGSVYGGVVDFTDPNDTLGGSVGGFAYTWNPDTKSYLFCTDILPGLGYWIAVTDDCTLSLDPSP